MYRCVCPVPVSSVASVCRSLSSLRAISTTVAPSSASSTADARPIPCVLPQTRAVLPVRLRFIYCVVFLYFQIRQSFCSLPCRMSVRPFVLLLLFSCLSVVSLAAPPSHLSWDRLLKRYVNEHGMVDYQGMKRD